MKKLLVLIASFLVIVTGCSCAKVTEATYESAYTTYKNTDAISFKRIEEVRTKGSTSYLKKSVSAKFIYDVNNNVDKMEYSLTEADATSSGRGEVRKITRYYFDKATRSFYTYSKYGGSTEEKNKETINNYSDKININSCTDTDLDCQLLIVTNLAPFKALKDIDGDLTIDYSGDEIKFSYVAACPSYENCSGPNQMITYTVALGNDGNFYRLSYEIENGNTVTTVKYTFDGLGSNNVSIEFPNDLRDYTEIEN